jgi:hypothetical protein
MGCDAQAAWAAQRVKTGTWRKASDSNSSNSGGSSSSDDVPNADGIQRPGSGVGAFSPNIDILERRQRGCDGAACSRRSLTVTSSPLDDVRKGGRSGLSARAQCSTRLLRLRDVGQTVGTFLWDAMRLLPRRGRGLCSW